jgi:hypothetical protein
VFSLIAFQLFLYDGVKAGKQGIKERGRFLWQQNQSKGGRDQPDQPWVDTAKLNDRIDDEKGSRYGGGDVQHLNQGSNAKQDNAKRRLHGTDCQIFGSFLYSLTHRQTPF